MTTTMHSAITARTINLAAARDGVRLDPQYGIGDITVDRAEFLAAVEDEHGHNTPNLARLLVRAGVRAPEEAGR